MFLIRDRFHVAVVVIRKHANGSITSVTGDEQSEPLEYSKIK